MGSTITYLISIFYEIPLEVLLLIENIADKKFVVKEEVLPRFSKPINTFNFKSYMFCMSE
jgi:hypothetical protein